MERLLHRLHVRDTRSARRLRPGSGQSIRYGVTVTVAEALTIPPMPLHVRVYVHNPVAAGTSRCLPFTGSSPFQSPVASHDCACVDFHLISVPPCRVIVAGVEVSSIVGTGSIENRLPHPPPPF